MTDLAARLEQIKQRNNYEHYRPLTEAIPGYVEWARNPNERIYTGIEPLDRAMRGTGPGQMTLVVAFAQAGKTVFVTNLLLGHPHKRIAFFTPDESRELLLVKLACAQHGISAEDLELQLQAHDEYAEFVLRDTAERFERLAVFDDISSIAGMERALDEAEDAWGHHRADLVVFDYLDLMDDGEEANARATAIKAWGKRRGVPLFVLHQASRAAGADGQVMTLTSATHGGERQATHMIGIRRKKYEIEAHIRDIEARLRAPLVKNAESLQSALDDLRYQREIHEHTLTVSLLKNKTPPGRLVDDIDFELDRSTGRLTPLNGDLPRAFREQQRERYRQRVEQQQRAEQPKFDEWGEDG